MTTAPRKRSVRHGVDDLWHRTPRKGEQVFYPADNADGPVWCMDRTHFKDTGTMVCTTRHGTGKRWRAEWVDHDGKRATAAYDSKAEAQRRADDERTAINTGTYADPQRSAVTFGMVAEAWHETKRAASRAPKTVAGYRELLDNVILPRWETYPLRDIDHERLQQWCVWLSTDPAARRYPKRDKDGEVMRVGLSPARVIQIHQVLSQVFAYAIRARYLAVNPADSITLPSKPQSKELALTHEQVRRLADETAAAPVRQRADLRPALTALDGMVRFLSYSGLRFGEAAALRVSDVDLAKRRVNVSKGITGVRGQGRVEGDTKTHQRRSVPILTTACLDELRLATEGRKPSEYLYPGPDGEAMTVGWFRVRFDKAAAKLGLGEVTPHTLRHTAGSLALAEGASVATVQKLLGHRNATTTMNVYSHMLPDDFDNLAAAMNKVTQVTPS
ncbi:tyrosine-type recombinase/integrase [Mycolicibacterium palauense]|uniref:tyrosine-type recombinase/integrase n=1 Tax=Mycolicibacterium palauense TaxID=2034511 RepID=UPI000BFED964|nr:site-specific integrase [Mycolicibacterium palauense]